MQSSSARIKRVAGSPMGDEVITVPKPVASNPHPIEHGVAIGHVHLKVSDLNRALDFYFGVLGFDLMQRYGDEAAFLSAGGYACFAPPTRCRNFP